MKISVGITTRNRPIALRRCLASVRYWLPEAEVLVFDDGSEPPAARHIDEGTGPSPVRVIERPDAPGNIVGRNVLVGEARHESVLLLDDDAALLDRDSVEQALHVLERDGRVGAVAFAQAEADGAPWPDTMQPATGSSARYVCAFIGFAHLVRRGVFLGLGGYQEQLVFYGEEKDFCLRMLDAGLRTVYLPHARVAHLPDPSGREKSRYVRYVIRNDCLSSLYNDPLLLVLAGIPVRFGRYVRMSRRIPGGDPGGLAWLLSELAGGMPRAWRGRHAVRWATLREWRRLRREVVPYPARPLPS